MLNFNQLRFFYEAAKAQNFSAAARSLCVTQPAVTGQIRALEEALERYSLTNDEFLSWQRSIERHGMAGLRTTRLQQYR